MHTPRARRGSATVEMAISMLLIIPAFMYVIFLDDLLRYTMDLQEAVVSTVWDFTGQDYTRKLPTAGGGAPRGGGTAVQSNARLMFCDHESGQDAYEQPLDCGQEGHHNAVVGHVCWIHGEAHQITCEELEPTVGVVEDPTYRQYQETHQKNGGMVRCRGKTGVSNYLLPKQFLPEFSSEKLSKHNWKDSTKGIHDDAKESTGGRDGTTYLLAEQHASLLTDSWALNKTQRQRPDDKPDTAEDGLYVRMKTAFEKNPGYGRYEATATLFTRSLTAQRLLSPRKSVDNKELTDNPMEPTLAITPDVPPSSKVQEERGSVGYFSTPWRDWNRRSRTADAYKKTHEARGNHYMGCKAVQGCG